MSASMAASPFLHLGACQLVAIAESAPDHMAALPFDGLADCDAASALSSSFGAASLPDGALLGASCGAAASSLPAACAPDALLHAAWPQLELGAWGAAAAPPGAAACMADGAGCDPFFGYAFDGL
jgi:hypothetical protein